MEYIEYLKALIEGVFVGFSAPLPISSSVHMFLTEKLMSTDADRTLISFYFYVYMLTFSVVLFLNFRSLYIKTYKGLIRKEKTALFRGKNLLISVAISLFLFLPISENGGAAFLFDGFMSQTSALNPFLAGIGSVFSGVILLLCLWYAKHNRTEKKNTASRIDVVKNSLLSLPAYLIPGLSKVTNKSVGLILCDIVPVKALRECYFYLAPELFIISLIKIIFYLIDGVNFDPVALSIGILSVAVINLLVLNILRRFSIKKLFGFCSAYSVVIGIITVAVGLIN